VHMRAAHQNLNVTPDFVSLLTFNALSTPCAPSTHHVGIQLCSHARAYLAHLKPHQQRYRGVHIEQCSGEHTCAMCMRPDGSKPS